MTEHDAYQALANLLEGAGVTLQETGYGRGRLLRTGVPVADYTISVLPTRAKINIEVLLGAIRTLWYVQARWDAGAQSFYFNLGHPSPGGLVESAPVDLQAAIGVLSSSMVPLLDRQLTTRQASDCLQDLVHCTHVLTATPPAIVSTGNSIAAQLHSIGAIRTQAVATPGDVVVSAHLPHGNLRVAVAPAANSAHVQVAYVQDQATQEASWNLPTTHPTSVADWVSHATRQLLAR